MARIAISGTGFIGTGLALALASHPRLSVSAVLTRRPPSTVQHPYPDLLNNNIDHSLNHCDLLVECSGDVLHATTVIDAALRRNIPVITMNAEFHVTVGSAFVERGYLSEAEGDQPGCLAALDRRVRDMGFTPVVYGNIKGFLNHTPSPEDMQFWANKQGIRLEQVTAFTDGSKVQIEQAFVANGLGADILAPGLSGPHSTTLEATSLALAAEAESRGAQPISDYVLNPGGPAGVFIVARHHPGQQRFLEYLKLGPGPHYFLLQPFHLCHLEIARSIEAALAGAPPLLNNSRTPRVGVVAIAKKSLPCGHHIERALGSFEFRGEATSFADHHQWVPIGLLQHARLRTPVEAGQRLRWDQVELPPSLALTLFQQLLTETPR
ncbi:MAG: NAD(P)-dependent oxidoreductase [Gammaproteobacteria bacterium HGW-Gammaproteobacteria-14]|nr:MAG: NAD(P)-dependent oxidoreductase [Gammaproteobacteria bacterium HGW-Gammaproteobacteria-14]